MKILELTNFSAGIDGVWTRVREESMQLSKKHEVKVFSSNLVKGESGTAKEHEKIGKVDVRRFPATKLGGESYMKWEFESEALEFKPDLIIAHCYRHTHTIKALRVGKKLGAKVFLVTHAPFVEGNKTRSFLGKLAVTLYDSFLGGSRKLNKFDKIIAITKWEMPYLHKLGVKSEKIEYIPNGIPVEFFKQKKSKESKKILFLGRISPIKRLETLIESIVFIKDKKIKLEIVGKAESEYLAFLKQLVKLNKLEKRVTFTGPIYDLKKKIQKIDSASIFVLPSKREAMPQALIEAMSREKIVIASKNPGSLDIIKEGRNGLLFESGDSGELASKIDFALASQHGRMRKEAKEDVKQFSWDKIIKKIEALL